MAGNSDFGALLRLRGDWKPEEPVTQSPDHLVTQVTAATPAAAVRRKGKSQNPDFDRLTVYLNRETILALNRRKVEEGRELSELVQEALDAWLR